MYRSQTSLHQIMFLQRKLPFQPWKLPFQPIIPIPAMPRNRCIQNQIFPLNTGISADHAHELHSMPKSYQCLQGSNIWTLGSPKERHIKHSVKQEHGQMKNSCLFAWERGALHPDSNWTCSKWKRCWDTAWGSERETANGKPYRPGDSCEKGIPLLQQEQ